MSDLSLTHLRFVLFEKSNNMLSQEEGGERVVCNLSNSLEVEGREQGGQEGPGTHHEPIQPNLATTTTTTKILHPGSCQGMAPCTCQYLCFFYLFIYLFVLNEMSPMVSFLVGYLENYFQKLVCRQIMSDQKVVRHY